MRSFIIALISLVAAVPALATITQSQIVFETSKGKLVFTHSDHQEAEQNCDTCHADKKYGRMPGFNKDMAHKLCITCHQQKGGPVKCEECHEK